MGIFIFFYRNILSFSLIPTYFIYSVLQSLVLKLSLLQHFYVLKLKIRKSEKDWYKKKVLKLPIFRNVVT